MKMSKRHFYLVASLVLACSFVVSGCKKKEEVVEETGPSYDDLLAENSSLNNKVSSLESEVSDIREVLANYAPDLVDTDLSNVQVLDTGETAYIAVDDKIRLHGDIPLNDDIKDVQPNKVRIYVSDDISIAPGDNWTYTTRNNALDMKHRDGLYFSLENVKYYENWAEIWDVETEYLKPYFKMLGLNNFTTRRIYDNATEDVLGFIGSAQMKVKAYEDGSYKLDPPEFEPEYLLDTDGNPILDEYGLPQQLAIDEFGEPLYDENGQRIIIPNEAPPVKEPVYLTDENGNLVWQTDENGDIIPATDENGEIIYQKDEDGNILYLLDEEGNMVYQKDEEGNDQPIPLVQGIPIEIEEEPEEVVADYTLKDFTYKVALIYDMENWDFVIIKSYFENNGATDAMQSDFFDTLLKSLIINGKSIRLE